jgi:HSP20 family protein
MKLNRIPSSNLNHASHLDNWLRNPFAGFSAVSQILDSLPDFTSSAEPPRVPADIFEDEESYSAHFEIPGVRREDVKLELHEERLTLTAVRKHPAANAETCATLTRTLSLPRGVERDSISAKLEHGILVVTLPKSSEKRPKTIEVL